MTFHIYITDASFDYESKTSILAIKNLSTKEEFQFIEKNVKSSTDGELFGLKKAIEIAIKTKSNNVVFICDNKNAINAMRNEFKKEENRSFFWYIQFLWLPREYMHEVDFLSKNINDEHAEKLKNIRNEAKTNKTDHFVKKHLTTYINEVKGSANTDALQFRINQFNFFKEQYMFVPKSSFFSNPDINADFFDEIDLIEQDIKDIKNIDPVFGIIAQTIFDGVICI